MTEKSPNSEEKVSVRPGSPEGEASSSPTIVVAGASGFVGRALIYALAKEIPNCRIIGLSRSPRVSEDPKVEWRVCDLFSLKSIEAALPASVDVAYYLVHSMMATASLDQGGFDDYDLIIADNFARALRSKGLQHLIYLGGLLPRKKDELSPHLASRYEVECVFRERGFPLTIFRAGMIIGPGGSSFEILLRLVRRLPVMICPRWTLMPTDPVELSEAVRAMVDCAKRRDTVGKTYDLSGCEPLTYLEMIRETAKWLGLKRVLFSVPFFTARLSRLWVTLVTRMPKALIYPLIESLRCEMVPRPDHFYFPPKNRTYRKLLESLASPGREKSRRTPFNPPKRSVRSVQRLPLPPGMDAEAVRVEYMRWLPRFFRPFLQVDVGEKKVKFLFLHRRILLLELTASPERSSSDRQLLYITGGFLADGKTNGRIEFREVLNRRYVLAAIHDYRPLLPWYVYTGTQAKVHLWVMKAFRRHLQRLGAAGGNSPHAVPSPGLERSARLPLPSAKMR